MLHRLVSPDRKKLYVISATEEGLKGLCDELRLSGRVRGNLRQLCRHDLFASTATRDHRQRENWQFLEDITWLRKQNRGDIVPVVGLSSAHL